MHGPALNPKCYRHKPKSCGCNEWQMLDHRNWVRERLGLLPLSLMDSHWGKKPVFSHILSLWNATAISKNSKAWKSLPLFTGGRLKFGKVSPACVNSAALTVGCKGRKVRCPEGFDGGWPFPSRGQHLNFQAVQHWGPQVGHREYVMILETNKQSSSHTLENKTQLLCSNTSVV